MDELAIWAMAVYPNVGGFGSQVFLGLKDPELMLACVRAYNDFLTDWCDTDSRRLIPITALPFWDVKLRSPRSNAAPTLGHKGILFTGEPQSHGLPVLGESPLESALGMRAGPRSPDQLPHRRGQLPGRRSGPRRRSSTTAPAASTACSRPALFLDNAKQIIDLLFSGVLPALPRA